MRFRSIAVGAAFFALVALVPASSHAAAAAVYSVKGTMTVVPKSKEGPGYWSMKGYATLVRGAGKAPKTGTLSAGGPLGAVAAIGPMSLPRIEIGATTGVLKIAWPNAPTTRATVAHAMAHPVHIITGPITSGYARYGVIVLRLQHWGSNAFAGDVILAVSGTVDK